MIFYFNLIVVVRFYLYFLRFYKPLFMRLIFLNLVLPDSSFNKNLKLVSELNISIYIPNISIRLLKPLRKYMYVDVTFPITILQNKLQYGSQGKYAPYIQTSYLCMY